MVNFLSLISCGDKSSDTENWGDTNLQKVDNFSHTFFIHIFFVINMRVMLCNTCALYFCLVYFSHLNPEYLSSIELLGMLYIVVEPAFRTLDL